MIRFLCLLFIFVPALAHAQWGGGSSHGHFSFSMSAYDPGCITISSTDGTQGYPYLPNGTATEVRFFYERSGPNAVTENSPYLETSIIEDEDSSYPTVTPLNFCGFPAGHYFLKYGLYDSANQLLEFMDPDDYESYSNSVVVKDPSPFATPHASSALTCQ